MAMRWIRLVTLNRFKKKAVKFDNINEVASDAAPLSPGGAVADFSARERTTVDDPATNMDMSGNCKNMVPLVGDEVACPVCEKSEVQFFFMNLTDLGKHLDHHHAEAPSNGDADNVKGVSRSCMGLRATYLSVDALVRQKMNRINLKP
jgi:hypothetical protein